MSALLCLPLFLDCEFTSLARPRLLSMGLCARPPEAQKKAFAQAGNLEFYAELDLTAPAARGLCGQMNAFVRKEVRPQLGGQRLGRQGLLCPSEQALGRALSLWLGEVRRVASDPFGGAQPNGDAGSDLRLEVAYDYHTDFDLFERVLRASGDWEQWAPRLAPTPVAYLWGDSEAQAQAQLSWEQSEAREGLRRHHALADARALACAFEAVHGGPSSEGPEGATPSPDLD